MRFNSSRIGCSPGRKKKEERKGIGSRDDECRLLLRKGEQILIS